jgi:hypothetical protein
MVPVMYTLFHTLRENVFPRPKEWTKTAMVVRLGKKPASFFLYHLSYSYDYVLPALINTANT